MGLAYCLFAHGLSLPDEWWICSLDRQWRRRPWKGAGVVHGYKLLISHHLSYAGISCSYMCVVRWNSYSNYCGHGYGLVGELIILTHCSNIVYWDSPVGSTVEVRDKCTIDIDVLPCISGNQKICNQKRCSCCHITRKMIIEIQNIKRNILIIVKEIWGDFAGDWLVYSEGTAGFFHPFRQSTKSWNFSKLIFSPPQPAAVQLSMTATPELCRTVCLDLTSVSTVCRLTFSFNR